MCFFPFFSFLFVYLLYDFCINNNRVFVTLAVDGCTGCYIWYNEEGLAGCGPKCNSPPINSQWTNCISFDVTL